jgi:acyl-CoA synthetase (AMP-forming)/AMP-acid ligase II
MPDRAQGPLRARIASALDGRQGGEPALIGARAVAPLCAMAEGGFIAAPAGALDGARVLVRTAAPLAAALALADLDGVAARLVLCPPDLGEEALAHAMRLADVDAVVTDMAEDTAGAPTYRIGLEARGAAGSQPGGVRETQWALFTSGTSGAPKLVAHTLAGLTGAIAASQPGPASASPPVWATFYDIRRYGGLQMLLRALVGGHSLVLADPGEATAELIARMARHGATHVSGTPTHWRRALMTPGVEALSPRYVRLSGEIADQAVLDALKARWPQAAVGHAYASTEAGVGFEVSDGLEGFPAALVGRDGPVEMRVDDGVLKMRSGRAASGYLGPEAPALHDADGFVDTGDVVERRGDRFHFAGRASGVINVGGLKIHPEEVEAVINACPGVRLSRVLARRSPLLGALVAAEVVAEPDAEPEALRAAIAARCRAALASHKAPASVRFVDALAMSAGGKLERRGA